jgi:hypothetical protein
MEPGNIGVVPLEQTKADRRKWQANNKNTVIRKGGFVKLLLASYCGTATERMWVKVEYEYNEWKGGNGSMCGLLWNTPAQVAIAARYSHGDEVPFYRDEVIDYMTEAQLNAIENN